MLERCVPGDITRTRDQDRFTLRQTTPDWSGGRLWLSYTTVGTCECLQMPSKTMLRSQGHDMGANNDVMKQLAALMHGKKHDGPEGMKGFGLKLPGFAPMPGREQNQLREGGVAGGGLHAHF